MKISIQEQQLQRLEKIFIAKTQIKKKKNSSTDEITYTLCDKIRNFAIILQNSSLKISLWQWLHKLVSMRISANKNYEVNILYKTLTYSIPPYLRYWVPWPKTLALLKCKLYSPFPSLFFMLFLKVLCASLPHHKVDLFFIDILFGLAFPGFVSFCAYYYYCCCCLYCLGGICLYFSICLFLYILNFVYCCFVIIFIIDTLHFIMCVLIL